MSSNSKMEHNQIETETGSGVARDGEIKKISESQASQVSEQTINMA
jgi:hypothetical protein